MTNSFDKDYWESRWQGSERASDRQVPPHPYLESELADLTPGTALDAGCGEGTEATWLASQGWQVTAADISAEALRRASQSGPTAEQVEWIKADLSVWSPNRQFDLVTTFYAHSAMPQLAFYERIADWVAPNGTLLIVGHLHTDGQTHGHGHNPPAEASVTATSVQAVLDSSRWQVATAETRDRTLSNRFGQPVSLRDVIVRAARRG